MLRQFLVTWRIGRRINDLSALSGKECDVCFSMFSELFTYLFEYFCMYYLFVVNQVFLAASSLLR